MRNNNSIFEVTDFNPLFSKLEEQLICKKIIIITIAEPLSFHCESGIILNVLLTESYNSYGRLMK